MKSTSSKTIEKRLEKKQADLQSALESRQRIDEKIRGLREEIETLQSTQLEHVFQQVKKSILKEGLRVDADAVSGILQSIRDNQGISISEEQESGAGNEETGNIVQNAPSSYEDGSYFHQEEESAPGAPSYNSSRLP